MQKGPKVFKANYFTNNYLRKICLVTKIQPGKF